MTRKKIFSIVMYKNLYPNDFSKLQTEDEKSSVSIVFKKKNDYVKDLVSKAELEVLEIQKTIQASLNEQMQNESELRHLFLSCILKCIYEINPRYTLNQIAFTIDAATYQAHTFVDLDFDFEKLEPTTEVFLVGAYRKKILDIEIENGFSDSFSERYKNIKNKEKRIQLHLHQRIVEIRESSEKIGMMNLSEILLYDEKASFYEDLKLPKCLTLFLRKGYICEDYPYYISYFYPGSLTLSDYKYLMSVKNRTELSFDYRLNSAEEIVNRLDSSDLKSRASLNFMMMDFLLANKALPPYDKYFALQFDQICRRPIADLAFIDEYRHISKHKELFINYLFSERPQFWTEISYIDNYSNQLRQSYLLDIIIFADNQLWKEIESNNQDCSIIQYSEKQINLISLFVDRPADQVIRAIEFIDTMNLKLLSLETISKQHDLYNCILNGNHYVISAENIRFILNENNIVDNNDYEKKNYYAICHSKCEQLIDYVNKNMSFYIENVFLTFSENSNEPEYELLKILNDEDNRLSVDLKFRVIEKCDTCIININQLNSNLWKKVFDEQKILVNWDNILCYYAMVDEIDDILTKLLNDENNAKILSYHKIDTATSSDEDVITKLSRSIAFSSGLTNATVNLLSQSITLMFYDIQNPEDISVDTLRILINNNILGFSKQVYNIIWEHFKELIIIYIEKYMESFLEANSSDLEPIILLDIETVNCIIMSKNIADSQKNKIISLVDSEIICTTTIQAEHIYTFVLGNVATTELKPTLTLSIIKLLPNRENKLKILSNQIKYLTDSNIEHALNQISSPYDRLTKETRQVVLLDTPDLRILLDNLRQRKRFNISSVVYRKRKIYVYKKVISAFPR